MRKTKLTITRPVVHGHRCYCVTIPKLSGGRTRRFFQEKAEAQSFLELAKVQLENHGIAALSVSDRLRVEAVECERRLAEFGKSLRDATDFYLAHLRAVEKSCTVRDVVAELLKARKADGSSVRYLGDLRVRLARFAGEFGEAMIAAVTAKQVSDWLRGLSVGPVTRNSYRRRLAALFSFARRNGYVTTNPLPDVERASERETVIEILTVAETARLLESADAETLPYWAIGAFAGLRSAEIERLVWSEVDFEDGFIEVKAAKAKTGSRRLVPMAENLRQWLAPYRNAVGPVCPVGLRKRLEADRERAALRAQWPQNALRHSFGSYRLPIIADAAKLALEMGNSPAMVFKHYREVVKPKVAAQYWNIRPTLAENVVALAG